MSHITTTTPAPNCLQDDSCLRTEITGQRFDPVDLPQKDVFRSTETATTTTTTAGTTTTIDPALLALLSYPTSGNNCPYPADLIAGNLAPSWKFTIDFAGGTTYTTTPDDGYVYYITDRDGAIRLTYNDTDYDNPYINFEMILVAGGGGAGSVFGGGGGAGGVSFQTLPLYTSKEYPIVVGSGGLINEQGGSTQFDYTFISYGGGAGGTAQRNNAGNGGSGGGAAAGSFSNGGSVISEQGKPGASVDTNTAAPSDLNEVYHQLQFGGGGGGYSTAGGFPSITDGIEETNINDTAGGKGFDAFNIWHVAQGGRGFVIDTTATLYSHDKTCLYGKGGDAAVGRNNTIQPSGGQNGVLLMRYLRTDYVAPTTTTTTTSTTTTLPPVLDACLDTLSYISAPFEWGGSIVYDIFPAAYYNFHTIASFLPKVIGEVSETDGSEPDFESTKYLPLNSNITSPEVPFDSSYFYTKISPQHKEAIETIATASGITPTGSNIPNIFRYKVTTGKYYFIKGVNYNIGLDVPANKWRVASREFPFTGASPGAGVQNLGATKTAVHPGHGYNTTVYKYEQTYVFGIGFKCVSNSSAISSSRPYPMGNNYNRYDTPYEINKLGTGDTIGSFDGITYFSGQDIELEIFEEFSGILEVKAIQCHRQTIRCRGEVAISLGIVANEEELIDMVDSLGNRSDYIPNRLYAFRKDTLTFPTVAEMIYDSTCTPTTTTTTTTTTLAPVFDATTTTTTTLPPCATDLSKLKLKYLVHNDMIPDSVWKNGSIKNIPLSDCGGYFTCGEITTSYTNHSYTARQEKYIQSDLYAKFTLLVEDCQSNSLDFAQLIIQFYKKSDGQIVETYVSDLTAIDDPSGLVVRRYGGFAKGEQSYYWIVESYLDG